MTDAPAQTSRPQRRRLRLAAFVLAGVAAFGLVGAEAFLRVRYGLGDPPVTISDTQTEYRMLPDGHYRRLGHRIEINAFSMRSEPIETKRSTPGQRRVLFLGDSVIFGGAYTDQDELATSLVQARLRTDVAATAVVGNASAGSWGPQNLLGYVEEFGLFDADVVVVVVSSHDAFDEIGTIPPTTGQPSRTYWFALSEAWDRVAPRWFPSSGPAARPDDPPPNHQGASEPCLAALGKLIDTIRGGGATPIVALHYERPELDAAVESEGHRLLRATCASRGVEPISLAPAFRTAIAGGEDPYRDPIHPNAAGQRAIAAALIGPIEAALRSPASQPAK